jgi:hypothetical protein
MKGVSFLSSTSSAKTIPASQLTFTNCIFFADCSNSRTKVHACCVFESAISPLLSSSFMSIIPSCESCNRLPNLHGLSQFRYRAPNWESLKGDLYVRESPKRRGLLGPTWLSPIICCCSFILIVTENQLLPFVYVLH